MNTTHPTAYYLTGAICAAVTVVSLLRRRKSPLDNVPTVGANSWLGSWWDGVKFLTSACDIVEQGYLKYKGKPFKVATVVGWLVIITGSPNTEHFFKFRENEIDRPEEFSEVLKGVDQSLETDDPHHPYYTEIIRHKLNRSLATVYDEMRDEIVMAYSDLLDLKGDEWKSIPLLQTTQRAVSRTSNRVFVGLPLCRIPEWVQCNIDFTVQAFKVAALLALLPKFMAPVVKWLLNDVYKTTTLAEKLIAPVIEERRRQLEENGPSWTDKPNNFLTWLLEGSRPGRKTNPLTYDIMGVNMVAIHTSSQAFALALYNLASSPESVKILREEVERITKEEGWSKESLSKMHIVDSFMKETKRLDASGFMSVFRRAVKDITLADGTVVPKGTFVTPSLNVQFDDETFEDSKTFDPLRFVKKRTGEDTDAIKYQFTSTSTEYMVFGHGRLSCPGRFFAASMLTTMLAHVVTNYDVKLEHDATPGIGAVAALKPTSHILIRKRAT